MFVCCFLLGHVSLCHENLRDHLIRPYSTLISWGGHLRGIIAHNKPDASKRGNSGGADTVNLGVSGQYGVAAAVRPGVSPHVVLTPMNHSKTESLLKLAEGLTQQRQSAFSSFIDGCPDVPKTTTFKHEKDA